MQSILKKNRLCPRWAECRFQGYVCYHDHYHYEMQSCESIGKCRFVGERGMPQTWHEADRTFHCNMQCLVMDEEKVSSEEE
jgi:hypothetical protein